MAEEDGKAEREKPKISPTFLVVDDDDIDREGAKRILYDWSWGSGKTPQVMILMSIILKLQLLKRVWNF